MSSEPATDNQLAYAKKLGIEIPPGITKNEMSDAISARVDNDDPSAENYLEIAKKYRVYCTKHTGQKALFNRIFNVLNVKEREIDLAAWFTYCVYLSIMRDREGGIIDSPDHMIIREIAVDVSKFDNIIASIKRYQGHDFLAFGDYMSADGYTNTGGSERTIAYQMVSAALRQHIDFSIFPKVEKPITGLKTKTPDSNITNENIHKNHIWIWIIAITSIICAISILGLKNIIILIVPAAILYFLAKLRRSSESSVKERKS